MLIPKFKPDEVDMHAEDKNTFTKCGKCDREASFQVTFKDNRTDLVCSGHYNYINDRLINFIYELPTEQEKLMYMQSDEYKRLQAGEMIWYKDKIMDKS